MSEWVLDIQKFTVALKVAPRERSLATILSPIAPRERSLATVMSPIAPRERSHATVLSPVAPCECSLANVSPRMFSRERSHSSSVALREWYHVVKFSSALLVRMRTWDLVARVVLSVKSENCRVMTNREEKEKQLARILKSMSSSDDRLERAITALE